MRLTINGNIINLVLEDSQDVYHNTKASLKHRLAGEAMGYSPAILKGLSTNYIM
jgi:hypothetical protein